MKASRSPVRLQGVAVGGALPATGERGTERQRNKLETDEEEGSDRIVAGLRCAECDPDQQDGDNRSCDRERRAFEDVALAAVTELVRDDELHFAFACRSQQGVPDDDATCRPEPGDVGIGFDGSAAGVGDEDVPDGDACLVREQAELLRELFVGERLEVVEDRLEHERR